MGTPIYEYKVIPVSMLVPDGVNLATIEGQALADYLENAFDGMTKELSRLQMEYKGGTFEIVSHDIALLGNTMLVSFLARRVVGDQNMPEWIMAGD